MQDVNDLLLILHLHRHVIANDLSSTAVDAIKRNVEINGLGPSKTIDNGTELPLAETTSSSQGQNTKLGKVRVNEGDAWSVKVYYFHLDASLHSS